MRHHAPRVKDRLRKGRPVESSGAGAGSRENLLQRCSGKPETHVAISFELDLVLCVAGVREPNIFGLEPDAPGFTEAHF